METAATCLVIYIPGQIPVGDGGAGQVGDGIGGAGAAVHVEFETAGHERSDNLAGHGLELVQTLLKAS